MNDKYNDIKIWRILLDERSENFNKNGIYAGFRLIKCIYHRYDSSQNKIYLKSCGDYDIAIHIKTEGLYDPMNLFDLIKQNPSGSYEDYAQKLNVSTATIKRKIGELKSEGKIIREGSNKNGFWKAKN